MVVQKKERTVNFPHASQSSGYAIAPAINRQLGHSDLRAFLLLDFVTQSLEQQKPARANSSGAV